MYKCKYFEIHELVSPELYEVLGEEKCWQLLPEVVKLQLDQIREEFYSTYGLGILINNWGYGGDYKYSGVRPINCKIGAANSRHKQWVAFDLKPSDLESIEELQGFIKTLGASWNISRVEEFEHTPTWCHIEFALESFVDKPYYFKP